MKWLMTVSNRPAVRFLIILIKLHYERETNEWLDVAAITANGKLSVTLLSFVFVLKRNK